MKWTRKNCRGIMSKKGSYYENENGWVIEGNGHLWRAWKSYSEMLKDHKENWNTETILASDGRNWAKLAIVNWAHSFKDAKSQVQELNAAVGTTIIHPLQVGGDRYIGRWYRTRNFARGGRPYLKNGVTIESQGYELDGLATMSRTELVEEILGSFPYDYLVENNFVVPIEEGDEFNHFLEEMKKLDEPSRN